MPRPTPIPVRRAIYQQWKQGRSNKQIAESVSVPTRTVQHLIKGFRSHGEQAIATSYATQGGKLSLQHRELREAACQLRKDHPTWGSTVIQIKLGKQKDLPTKTPTSRTIRRWLVQEGLSSPPQSVVPDSPSCRAERPHQTWQMDASEDIRLASGHRVSWLRIVDEYTGAVLTTFVFSRGPLQPGRPA